MLSQARAIAALMRANDYTAGFKLWREVRMAPDEETAADEEERQVFR